MSRPSIAVADFDPSKVDLPDTTKGSLDAATLRINDGRPVLYRTSPGTTFHVQYWEFPSGRAHPDGEVFDGLWITVEDTEHNRMLGQRINEQAERMMWRQEMGPPRGRAEVYAEGPEGYIHLPAVELGHAGPMPPHFGFSVFGRVYSGVGGDGLPLTVDMRTSSHVIFSS